MKEPSVDPASTTPAGEPDRNDISIKDDLVGSLKGADVKGYVFALGETDDRKVSSLANNAVDTLIRLGNEDTGVTLRHTRVENTKTKIGNLFKTGGHQEGNIVAVARLNP